MKLHICLALLTLTVITSLAAENPPPPPVNSLTDALANGKFSLNARLRWEYADQKNIRDANAFTLRTRFGFTSAALDGFQGMIEGENTSVIGPRTNYNAAGSNPGGAGRTSIADAPVTDLNQAWLSYAYEANLLKLGRQRIVLDNARFVGDVGWRQNMQTFDAATLNAKLTDKLTAYYGYVWHVSRVFGNLTPQPDFKSDSHIVNVVYSGIPYRKLTAYAYLLNFKNSAPNSSNTYGLSFAGSAPVSKTFKLTYRAEYATQSDAANNPVNYTANYYLAQVGGVAKPFNFAAGYEVLGSDHGRKGFATPLATLHAFNGWADEFLATPAKGLRDSYLSAGVDLPGGFPLNVVYHKFDSDFGGANYGDEWDGVVSHKLSKNWVVLAKAAHYNGKPPFFDTNKFWLQVEFNY